MSLRRGNRRLALVGCVSRIRMKIETFCGSGQVGQAETGYSIVDIDGDVAGCSWWLIDMLSNWLVSPQCR